MLSCKTALVHTARITLTSSLIALLPACGDNSVNDVPPLASSSSSSMSSSVPIPSSSSMSSMASSKSSSSIPISSSSLSSSSVSSSSSIMASSSSQSSSPISNMPSGDLIINDNFDSGGAGEVPAGWRTILGYGLVDNSRPPSPGSSAVIDSSKAHSGSNSVKVSTSTAQAPHFIFKELPSGMKSIYVRTWIYSNTQIGGGAAGGAGDHSHFMGTLQTPGEDSGDELRFGPVKKAYLGGFMPKYSDSFSNNTTAGSIPANKWTCVEWAVEKGNGFDKMYGWVGNTKVLSAESKSDWANGPRGDFVNANSTKYISFGWRRFGSGANVSSIWFDDIAVGTKRIGCN